MIDLPSTYVDPQLSIKDLDTGRTFALRDIEQSNALLKSVRVCTKKKILLPQGVNLSIFTNLIQPDLIPNLTITDLAFPHQKTIDKIAVSKSQDIIATADIEGLITILTNFTINKTIPAHNSPINSLDFSTDDHLLSASDDGTAKFWKRNLDRAISTLKHDGPVLCARFFPNDPNFAVTCSGKEVIFWDARREIINNTLQFLSEPTALDFTVDGRLIVIGCKNGYCYLYELERMLYVGQFACGRRRKQEIIPKGVFSLSCGPESIVVSTSDCRVRLYDIHDYHFQRKFLGYGTKKGDEMISRVSFSADGQLIFIANISNGKAYVYPVDASSYFKKSALVKNIKEDASSTFFGFSLGDDCNITATVFQTRPDTNSVIYIVGDSHGRLYRIE